MCAQSRIGFARSLRQIGICLHLQVLLLLCPRVRLNSELLLEIPDLAVMTRSRGDWLLVLRANQPCGDVHEEPQDRHIKEERGDGLRKNGTSKRGGM